ncbi:MAG: aminodeoxychorismate/anthranilate synthase component II [Lachnospiraceae bacterium]|nr:aminodeoxychorismate/anthranilate synthase component II [Lachnospiraceae bacterium]
MILLIDNYDSFSYNLFQYIGTIAQNIWVIRNDEMTVEEIDEMEPSHIIISPGPGRPKDAGICEELISKLKGKYPILGVCLGHQAICETFGAVIDHSKELMHGKTSVAHIDTDSVIFKGLKEDITVGRYHSLSAVAETVPDCLKVTARTDDGEIMAVEHKEYPVYGLQFHPESVLTPDGMKMIENFIGS